MICVLREVRPSLSVKEAMWRLLISDLNLLNACVASNGNTMDEKAVGNRKGLSVTSKKDMLRLKPFPSEKNYVCHMSKADFMAKFTNIAMKGVVHSKSPTRAGTSTSASEGIQHSSCNSPYPLPPDGGLKGGADVSDAPDANDYYSPIRFDETVFFSVSISLAVYKHLAPNGIKVSSVSKLRTHTHILMSVFVFTLIKS